MNFGGLCRRMGLATADFGGDLDYSADTGIFTIAG